MREPWGVIIMVITLAMFALGLAAGAVSAAERCEFERISSQSIKESVAVAGRAYRVDPCLIAAVIRAESGYDPRAVSVRGAEGLMQLMPNTARHLQVEDAFNPSENIIGGTKYLREMRGLFGSWKLAIIAYNWGPGNLARHGTHRMPKETENYLRRVQRYYGKEL